MKISLYDICMSKTMTVLLCLASLFIIYDIYKDIATAMSKTSDFEQSINNLIKYRANSDQVKAVEARTNAGPKLKSLEE